MNTGVYVSFQIRVLYIPKPKLCLCLLLHPSCLSVALDLYKVLKPGTWDSFLTPPPLPTFNQSPVPSALPPKRSMNFLHLHCYRALLSPGSLQVTFNFVPSCRNPFNTQRPEGNLKSVSQGFAGGTVVKNPPANAGDTGSSPGPGGSHMPGSSWACAPQLQSLRSRAQEPQLLSPSATTTEARVPRACALQQEKPPQ